MKLNVYFLATMSLIAVSCGSKAENMQAPSFPYEEYLEYSDGGDGFAVIGDDGDGFEPISNHIRYPEIQQEVALSPFADSLLQIYNIYLAHNTLAYDVSTYDRYMADGTIDIDHANAIGSIDLSVIKDDNIRQALQGSCDKIAGWIKEGVNPNEQEIPELGTFYDLFGVMFGQVLDGHDLDQEFDPASVIKGYDEMHQRAIADTLDYRQELLQRVLAETDFQKKCVLAREFAYANYVNPERDDKELVAVIDPIIKADEYSPLLGELWLIWRTALQKNIIGSPSNDGPIYNLFYNDMRNHVAEQYIKQLNAHPDDNVALEKFLRLIMTDNITRNSQCLFGNNSILDEMDIYAECWENKD